ncbi:MAG: AMP-binding protein [Caldilineaceae bacterium]
MTDNGSVSILDILEWRALNQSGKIAYRFWLDDNACYSLTYRELYLKIKHVAYHIREYIKPLDRVLVMHPPSLDYIINFFGCIYAGGIPVPVYPPRANEKAHLLESIIQDSTPKIALTSQDILARFLSKKDGIIQQYRIPLLNIETNFGAFDDIDVAKTSSDDIAFLQYTSGSTSSPKGVMVAHENLLHNLYHLRKLFEVNGDSIGVSWLPPYHDMGLIGGVLLPVYTGFPVVLMSPTSFVQSPIRWLELISQYSGSLSGAPSFAYDLCVRSIFPQQREGLDLSSWKVAVNGAEPVRADVLRRFTDAYRPHGFQPQTFFPCYGMAEATLIVSGGSIGSIATTIKIDRNELQQGTAVEWTKGISSKQNAYEVVSCGFPISDQRTVIVNPDLNIECSENVVGEVWVSGPSITKGYWNQPDSTKEIYYARLEKWTGQNFLRTGDLGFLHNGELYIVGRLKDLIIIRGKNFHPSDIEATASGSHNALLPGNGAAFTISIDEEEKVVVVHEVKRECRNPDINDIAKSIISSVAENHGLRVDTVALIRCYSIPKTTSGKIQRGECKKRFLNENLKTLAIWSREPVFNEESSGSLSGTPNEVAVTSHHLSSQDIEKWILEWISSKLDMSIGKINSNSAFWDVGLDSVSTVQMIKNLSDYLGIPLPATIVWDFTTVNSLARYLETVIYSENEQPKSSFSNLSELTVEQVASLLRKELNSLENREKGL